MGLREGSPEFRILGPLEVEGAPPLGGPRQRAARSLEVYASRLRKAIDATGAQILRRGSGYELALGSARVDAHEFEALVDEGRRALAAGDPAAAQSRLRDALGLWRGPALADLDGDAGAELEARRLAAAEDLADADLLLGRHLELVPELERRVRDEPLRERTRAQLMLALYRSGRQAEALQAFREARAALDELGLEPGIALRELEVAVLRQDASLDVEPHPPRASATPRAGDATDRPPRRDRRADDAPAGFCPAHHPHRAGRHRQDEARAGCGARRRRCLRRRRVVRGARANRGCVARRTDYRGRARRLGGHARLLGAAACLRDTSDATTDRVEVKIGERTRSEVEAALGQREFARAFESGLGAPEAVVAPMLGAPTSTLDA